ncbi:TPA: helix-turn-helix domain-containing protein [Streptococcus suis]
MNRIKELRERKNLTQQELADNLGISKRTLGYWEKGEVQIKPDKAQALADYFGVPVAYLLGYSEQLPDPEFEKQNNARLIGLFDKIIDNPNTRDELTPEIDKIMKDMAIETGRKEFYRLQNSDGFQKMVDYLTERQIKIVGEVLSDIPGLKKAKEIDADTIDFHVKRFFYALSQIPELEGELLAYFVTLSKSDKQAILSIVKSLNRTD